MAQHRVPVRIVAVHVRPKVPVGLDQKYARLHPHSEDIRQTRLGDRNTLRRANSFILLTAAVLRMTSAGSLESDRARRQSEVSTGPKSPFSARAVAGAVSCS